MKSPKQDPRAAARAARRHRVFLAIATTLSVLVLFGYWIRVAALEKIDWQLRDSLRAYLSEPRVPESFVLVAIDEPSLDLAQTLFPETLAESPTLQAMAKTGYPWPRSVYADLIEKLLQAGARKVVFDLLFSGPREGDDRLAQVLNQHPDQVILGINFDESSAQPGLKDSIVLSLPTATLLPNLRSDDPRLGYVNFWPDLDQITRSAIYVHEMNGKVYSSLALRAVADQIGGFQPKMDSPHYFRFADENTIPVIPFWQIFDPSIWKHNLQSGEFFRDKIVWVGPMAQRFHDELLTSASTLPGPMVHLLSATALLDQAFDHPAPRWLDSLLIIALAFLAMKIVRSIRRPFWGLASVLGLGALYWPAAAAVWEFGHLIPAILFPQLAIILTGLLCFGYDFTLERRERSRTRQMLDRYVSRDLVREALDHEETFLDSLNGSRRDVVVLFSDIRGFTTWSEKIEPEELVAQLNEYLSEMVAIVFENEGSVDKFVGDAVMAVWGTIGTHSPKQNALLATRAALAMQNKVTELNERWTRESRQTIRIGVGLHAGSAIFGNIGSEQKMEPTIIGDTVNVASRVEGLCKKLSAGLILTAPVAAAIQPEFEVVSLNTLPLAGRQAEIEVFTLKILDRKPD